jgi:hypothetical protein
MKVSEIYAGAHLKAIDLGGRASLAQISDVSSEVFDEGEKIVLHFAGKDKTLVCNATNSRMIAASFGDETETWKGKTIELYPDKVMFGGKLVDALRVRIPVPAAAPAAQPAAATAGEASQAFQTPPAADPAQPVIAAAAPATTEGEPFNGDIPW